MCLDIKTIKIVISSRELLKNYPFFITNKGMKKRTYGRANDIICILFGLYILISSSSPFKKKNLQVFLFTLKKNDDYCFILLCF